MTDGQKKSVALSIYMDVSKRFENFQRLWGAGDWFTDSGYSQDDLVSNLLGFYIAVGDLSKSQAIALSHPVSRETAEAIWKKEGSVGSNKNTEFKPDFADATARMQGDGKDQKPVDDCAGQPKKFPKEFQTIKPIEAGSTYVRLSKDALFSFF